MKIHEYQAKNLLRECGVPVPDGEVSTTSSEAGDAFHRLGGELAVVKAQIHAGGRGKGSFLDEQGHATDDGGGVQLVRSRAEAAEAAALMLGRPLRTHQTGPEGRTVQCVLVETGTKIAKEFYVGLVLDRARYAPVFMASSEGGMDIEEVAAKTPEKILKERIHPMWGMQPFQARRLAYGLGLEPAAVKKAVPLMIRLARFFLDHDCSLAEVNPLVLTEEGDVIALDAKVNFDSNGLFRYPKLRELRDLEEEDPKEVEASAHDLNYIALDGNIGCMVNGAGLAMATMDTIKLFGAEPANFLDVGGGATTEKVTAAFKILLSDERVQGVLVNIFGGIMKCDTIAEGVVAAAHEVKIGIPLVVRLEGTNVDLGKKILAESGLPIIPASSLQEAAQKICVAVGAEGGAR